MFTHQNAVKKCRRPNCVKMATGRRPDCGIPVLPRVIPGGWDARTAPELRSPRNSSAEKVGAGRNVSEPAGELSEEAELSLYNNCGGGEEYEEQCKEYFC